MPDNASWPPQLPFFLLEQADLPTGQADEAHVMYHLLKERREKPTAESEPVS